MDDYLASRIELHHFHLLLRRLRGTTPVEVIAARCEYPASTLRILERNRRPVTILEARYLLERGFELDRRDVDRLIVGIRLYDVGLRDNAIRALSTDSVLGTIPNRVRHQLRELYGSYSSTDG